MSEATPMFYAACASRHFFDQVANKWSVMILTMLCEEPRRFNAIKRGMEGITHKALTETLRKLERNGLVERTVLATSPIAVEYSLTPLGHSLQEPFAAIYGWAIDHVPQIVGAQEAFDKRQKPSKPPVRLRAA
jgi:DNA-binding HxlR family transcriptional regulator